MLEIWIILFPVCIIIGQDPRRPISHRRNVHLLSRIKSYDGNKTRTSAGVVI